MLQTYIDLIGWIPVGAVFVAQWTGSDRIWVVCNALFTLYHTFLTHLPPLAICSFVLMLISLRRMHIKKPCGRAKKQRIIGDTPLVEIAMPTEPTEEATQPTTEPPEDNDPVERAFWRFCMLIDKTQRAARVKAGYLEGPYPQRDAFKIAVRSTVLGLTVPTHIADASKKELADAAEKKESGSLKVGDRVEVPEGVWDLVHEGAIPPGQYEVTRNWEDGIIRIQRGSVRYLVRDSDLAPVKLNALKNQVQALAEKL